MTDFEHISRELDNARSYISGACYICDGIISHLPKSTEQEIKQYTRAVRISQALLSASECLRGIQEMEMEYDREGNHTADTGTEYDILNLFATAASRAAIMVDNNIDNLIDQPQKGGRQ